MTNEPSSPAPDPSARQLPRALRTFQSLVVPQYRTYFTAMFFYFAAMQMMVIARPVLALQLSANDTGELSFLPLGITVAANNLPSLLLSPWAGALADRMSMRVILQVCAVLMAALAAVLGTGVLVGFLEWWHVAIVSVLQGAVMTFITPTRRAIVSELVPQHYLLNAVSLHTMTLNFTRVIMPALAGFVIEFSGMDWAMWMIGGVYLAAMVFLFAAPLGTREASARKRSMASAVGDGFRYATKEPIIRNLLLIGFVAAVFGQPVQHLLPMFQDVLGIGEFQIGLLFTMMGVGSLLGSTTSASLGDFKRKGLLLVGFFTLLGASIAAFSASNIYLLSLFLMLPVGIGHSGRTAVHLAALQSYSDPSMRGRVMALNNMQNGFMPIAVLAITAMADTLGPQWSMGLSGAIILVYGLWEIFFSKTVRDLR